MIPFGVSFNNLEYIKEGFIMNHYKRALASFIFLLFLLTCFNIKGETPPIKIEKKKSNLTRPEKLKKIFTKAGHKLDLFIYTKTLKKYKPAKLAKLCSSFGIRNIYLVFSYKKYNKHTNSYAKRLKQFITLMSNKKIKVFSLIYNDIYPYLNKSHASSVIKSLTAYNNSCKKKSERFSGIISDLEPGSINKKNLPFHENYQPAWKKKNHADFPKHNNELLTKTYSILDRTKKNFKDLSLFQTIPSYFDSYSNPNEAFIGSSNNFLKHCNKLILMVYSDSGKKVLLKSKKALKKTTLINSVILCIKTSPKGKSNTTFYNMSWNNFLINIKTLLTKCSKYQSFNGIAIYDLGGLIEMMEK